ncbi:Glycosyl transferase, group 2 protein [Acididesulfobacillus acetoxydans]|nr:glycosyltransferase family 2 protein [Acididesulfobacillus acetoxydans]CEJ06096.1 Glycosyl transferase, group 2 protein [Acididesulfobacillus acetoxydans]
MTAKILLASPVKQKERILAEFLESVENLDTQDCQLEFAFIDDGNSHDLLTRFAGRNKATRLFRPGKDCMDLSFSKAKEDPPFPAAERGSTLPAPKRDSTPPAAEPDSAPHATERDRTGDRPSPPEDDRYLCDEETHHWRRDLIRKVAHYKDFLIDLAVREAYDHLFLVDSDLYLHPQTLRHLVSLGKNIVSEVFWTRWQPDMPPLPQVWVSDEYTLYKSTPGEGVLSQEEITRRTGRFISLLSRPGTYKVGGLGACTLISREALSRGVSFRQIYNLSFLGEDRHFCVRAAALGLELYADTHFPPFHFYRESDGPDLLQYKERLIKHGESEPAEEIGKEKDTKGQPAEKKPCGELPSKAPGSAAPERPRLTLAMLVRNEADRYLSQVLRQASQYINSAVILDDASEDCSAEICRRELADLPLTLVSNPEPGFQNEINLRKQLWNLACETSPEWILILDADEIFEEKAAASLRGLLTDPEAFFFAFRLYDMWAEGFYREDTYWNAHHTYRPFLVRYQAGLSYQWRETPQHCGRFPLTVLEFPGKRSDLRVKHLGWQRPSDRLRKYERYKKLDPLAAHGVAGQYESILDPKPHLLPWHG